MNWEALGAIGEVGGAIAVLVTLIYLATQIRQNTNIMTTSIYESAMDGYVQLNRTLLDSEIASIQRRSIEDPASLSEDELFRLNIIIRMWFNHVYKLFRLYEKGVFPEKEWENVARESADIMAMSGELMQAFRKQNHYFDDLYKELDQYPAGDFTSLKFLKEDA